MQCGLLSITLFSLVSGEIFRLLESQFRIGKETISRIAIDVCRVIFEILEPHYVSTPRNTKKWFEIAEKLYQSWDFLNGIGTINRRHIVVEAPFNSDTHCTNCKGTDSIILI